MPVAYPDSQTSLPSVVGHVHVRSLSRRAREVTQLNELSPFCELKVHARCGVSCRSHKLLHTADETGNVECVAVALSLS